MRLRLHRPCPQNQLNDWACRPGQRAGECPPKPQPAACVLQEVILLCSVDMLTSSGSEVLQLAGWRAVHGAAWPAPGHLQHTFPPTLASTRGEQKVTPDQVIQSTGWSRSSREAVHMSIWPCVSSMSSSPPPGRGAGEPGTAPGHRSVSNGTGWAPGERTLSRVGALTLAPVLLRTRRRAP